MYTITIKNLLGEITNGPCIFESLELANTWFNEHDNDKVWGRRDRWLSFPFGEPEAGYTDTKVVIDEPEHVEERCDIDENGYKIIDQIIQVSVPERNHIEYFYPKEYSVEIVDLEQDPDYQLEQVISKRVKEYGSPGEQFDIMYTLGFDAWKDHVTAVKTKNPKPVKKV